MQGILELAQVNILKLLYKAYRTKDTYELGMIVGINEVYT